MSENTETVGTAPSQNAIMAVHDMIKSMPGAPTPEQLEAWKKEHGSLFTSGFSDDEMFIWRPLTRREYREMQIAAQSVAALSQQDPSKGMDAQMRAEEEMVAKCVLWPKLDVVSLATKVKAGTVATLLEQIMQNSNFMTAQQASMLVIKL